MTLSAIDIYRSENGDVWQLMRDEARRVMFIRHEANLPSGGRITETSVDDFLRRDGSGPEYAAARDLLAALSLKRSC
jgi:hypothetical protein